ncbi:RIP metalloprotease RseP [Wohlfahrtiimonas larvae]|uniref:Zinc metalloprotease n=1 Tax=Wohlfahrtiimonas larvae TaxID=1157986 RepID=A0ABP9MKW0_9GAMM|nr:RIP metalloprotease RseP [Wohlfahrtiimonas larvae]
MIEWLESFFRSIGGFIILMGILVTIHEYGHFWVARKLGFAVTKFSIGFGKNIWSRQGKDGIEYAIGMIPLGGYVAFVDDAKDHTGQLNGMPFKQGKIWQKTAVVAAGPLANILLAIVLLWGLFMYGVPAYKPYVEVTQKNAPFAEAGLKSGDLVLSVDGEPVRSFEMMMQKLIEYLDDGQAEIIYNREGSVRRTLIDIGAPLQLDAKTDLYKDLGVALYLPPLPPVIGMIVEGGAAANTDLAVGDLITSVAGKPVSEWRDLLQVVSTLKSTESIDVEVLRNHQVKTIAIQPLADESGQLKLGIAVNSEIYKNLITKERLNPVGAFGAAIAKTIDDGAMIFKFIGRMIKGDFHINTMAGPVSIANIAGQALASGLVFFVQLTALFSINIGLLNLLPIPVLDGGRLVGFGIEKLMGKHQFSDSIKIKVLQIGAAMMFIFMAIVIGYDIIRWF